MPTTCNHNRRIRSAGPAGFACLRRAAPKGAFAIGIVAAGLTLAGPASADIGYVQMQWLNAQPIKVESDGSKYTKVANTAAPIQGSMIVHVEAEVSGKVKSWQAEPMLGWSYNAWDSFPASGASQSYGLPRPKTVHTAFPFAIAKADYAAFMVTACNFQADELRQQGLSNGQIFAEDRSYQIAVWGDLEFETTGIAGSPVPSEVADWASYPKVTVVCEGDTVDLDPAAPAITDATLGIDTAQKNNLRGACELQLSGNIVSRDANTQVKFRYVSDDGQQSDLKTVTTDANGFVNFLHVYPLGPDSKKNGKVQMIGSSHAFKSNWAEYELDCSAPPQDIVSLLPPKATGLEVIPTADKVMHRGLVCPAKVKIYGILKGRGKVSGAAALFADGQLKTLKQYSIEDGQTVVIEGEHELSWDNVQLPQQSIAFAMNVTNKAAELVDQLEKSQGFACTKVSTAGVAGGAAGGLSTGTQPTLPSQPGAVGQLTLQQAPAIAIMAPRGLVRHGQIRLSGGAVNATYDLTFYRKSGGGYVAVSSARLPRQMTGLTASFQLAALDGGRDWRIEVCPAGPAQGSCKTSDFRLPAIGAKQVEPAPGGVTPMIIVPGVLK